MKTIIIISLLLINAALSFSQVSLQWANTYNGTSSGGDASNAIVIDNSGNIVIAGSSRNGTTVSDFTTIKYLPSGSLVWSRFYNNSPVNNTDIIYAMSTDNSGNIYVTGLSYNSNDPDYATVKYNSSGVQQWVQRYDNAGPGNSGDISESAAADDSGNVYVTGLSIGWGTSNDFATIKYNSAGVQQWAVRFDTTDDRGYFVKLDKLGGVYAAGRSQINGRMGYAIVKYNAAGTRQWFRYYSPNPTGGNENIINGVVIDQQNNIIVTGSAYPDVNKSDLVTIKYSPAGVQQWIAVFDGPAHWFDNSNGITIDGAGNIYVCGAVTTTQYTSSSAVLLKYTANGQLIWNRTYQRTGSANNSFKSAAANNTGNVFVTGGTSNSLLNSDITTVGYDSSGNRLWERHFDGSGGQFDDVPAMIAADSIGNVYVTGTANSSSINPDMVTLKYTPNTSHDITCGPIFNIPPAIYQFQTLTIKNRIYNNSTTTENNIPVKWFVNGVLDSTMTRSLISGQYDTVSNDWTPVSPGSYQIKYVTSLSNDEDRSNDTSAATIQVFQSIGTTQTYSQCRNGHSLYIGSLMYVYDTIYVNLPLGSFVVDVKATVDTLFHTWDSDLEISLMHQGLTDSLIYHRGGSGDNFIHTALTDSALIPISQGVPPFTGSYRPESPLLKFWGTNPAGAWIIRILDPQGGDTGVLKAWCIQVTYTTPTGLPKTENIPDKFALHQNYPNPFNPVTKINYELPIANYVKLTVYDMLGREIVLLVNEKQEAGKHTISWDASNYPSGVYFYKIEAGNFVQTKKMVLMK